MKDFIKSIIIFSIAFFLVNVICVKAVSLLLINALEKDIDIQIEQEFNKQASELLKNKIIEKINESI